MRAVLALVAICSVARAQDSSIKEVGPEQAEQPPAQPPQPPPAPQPQPPPAQPPQPQQAQPQQAQPQQEQPPTAQQQSGPLTFGANGPISVSASQLSAPALHRPSVEMAERWHRGRAIYGVGGVIGLVGTALSISSIVLVAVTGYPCDPYDLEHQINMNDRCNMNGTNYVPPKPTDPAPLLAYMGSSVSALGFVVSAAGLGYQHYLLRELGSDIGRGVFGAGTTIGVMGFASVALSYAFGATSWFSNPHDQGLAILSASMTGAGLCLISSLLYTIDSARLKSAWNRLGTF